jgi:hypothetical protein
MVKWLANPLVGASATLLGVMAGVLASIRPEEIGNSLQFIGPGRQFAPWATLFWAMVVLFGLSFWGVQWANLSLTEAAQGKLKAAVDELRGLPERGFLALFDENFRDAYETLRVARRSDLAQQAHALRVILDSIVSLAVKYDRAAPEIIYAANVMVFRASDSLDGASRDRIQSLLKFTDGDSDLSHYLGVLELVPELSTTTATSAPQPDFNLKPFCLPVPQPSTRNDLSSSPYSNVLPGAPQAFFYRAAVAFPDYSHIRSVLDGVGDFSPSLKSEIVSYFATDMISTVKSFVSLPLFPPRGQPRAAHPIGVLSIHRNEPGILTNGFTDMFVPLSVPFRAALTEVLSRWKDAHT